MLSPTIIKIRMFGIRLPATLRVVATLVPVSVIIAPFPVYVDSFTGSLWIPGIALNIGQPAYELFRHLSDYPGYAATPYSYSRKPYQRLEKYQHDWSNGNAKSIIVTGRRCASRKNVTAKRKGGMTTYCTGIRDSLIQAMKIK